MKLKQWNNVFHVIVNANLIVQHVIENKNGTIKQVNVNVKIIVKCEKNYWWKLAHVFVRITSILKSYLYFSDYVWWNCYCY